MVRLVICYFVRVSEMKNILKIEFDGCIDLQFSVLQIIVNRCIFFQFEQRLMPEEVNEGNFG